jgi:hypothetical protein
MTLAAACLMVLASVMQWANGNSGNTARNNEYFVTSYAAEAATEKVLASLSQQYQDYGFTTVNQNMSAYAATLPTASDNALWANYQFSGGTTLNQIIVTNTATGVAITNVAGTLYAGLTMTANTYEIIANAQNTTTRNKIIGTVGQQIYLGTIPLFQFGIFYQGTMEIDPGANMTIGGTVHGNASIYIDPNPGATLTFSNNVSAVGSNVLGKNPLDPTSRTAPTGVIFDGFELSGVDPLNLPVGTNTTGTTSNTSENAYAILQLPQAGQTPTSATGTNLLYNKADMIIIIGSDNSISVTSGAGVNNQATIISNNQWSSWLGTNGSFYDQRDSLTVDPVVLNVSNLVNWSATNTVLRPVLTSLRGSGAADVQSIYVDDERSTSNAVVTTNIATGTNYSTNVTTTASYPGAGTYVPPVTTTNTTNTTSGSDPGSGTYVGSVTTNTTSTNSSSKPGAGTYLGSITTNGSGTNKTYSYNLITGYTYAGITGYTYNAIVGTGYTNVTYLTNWPIVSQPGIVLSNGAVLPPQGLDIATPDPAYIVGNWNVQLTPTGTSDAGLSDTTYTRPSAVYADAITILSSAWNPANSALDINSRTATSDTVNAAFLTGNVPSNGTYYSGGVENFPRLLENWSNQTFTYNGSMVAMFASQIANAPWPGTGSVYNPPTRKWGFDNNFNNPAKQPPLTPQIIMVQRGKWALLPPFTTSF